MFVVFLITVINTAHGLAQIVNGKRCIIRYFRIRTLENIMINYVSVQYEYNVLCTLCVARRPAGYL